MRLSALAVAVLIGIAAAVVTMAASAARAPTSANFLRAGTYRTQITPAGPRSKRSTSTARAVTSTRASRTGDSRHYVDEQIGGLARLQSDGRWAIYERVNDLDPPYPEKLVGFAVRRTSTRWDILSAKGRKIGYAVGPDGPEAAAPMLTSAEPNAVELAPARRFLDFPAAAATIAVDDERQNVAAFGVFRGTHTGEGGPVPPTGKKVEADFHLEGSDAVACSRDGGRLLGTIAVGQEAAVATRDRLRPTFPHGIEIGITPDQLFDELMEEHSGRHRDLAMMAGQ